MRGELYSRPFEYVETAAIACIASPSTVCGARPGLYGVCFLFLVHQSFKWLNSVRFPGLCWRDLTIVVAGVNCRLLYTMSTSRFVGDERKNSLVAEGLYIEGLRGSIQNIPVTLD